MSDTPGMITPRSDTPQFNTPQFNTARLLATEVLLAEPEMLGDDVLEACLYILRERLYGKGSETSGPAASAAGHHR